jgi:superoxide dismutase, Cu-Zn family
MLRKILLFTLSTAVLAKKAIAELKPDIANPLGKNLTGTITFEQSNASQNITITAKISGLAPNAVHGWHIHNNATSNFNCTIAGGHWNPKNVSHGAPDAAVRHYGDLGNIQANANGVVELTVTDRLVTLFGDINALGRGIIIHEKVDDLGVTDHPSSKTVGNAGSRLACANIQLVPETLPTDATPVAPVKHKCKHHNHAKPKAESMDTYKSPAPSVGSSNLKAAGVDTPIVSASYAIAPMLTYIVALLL